MTSSPAAARRPGSIAVGLLAAISYLPALLSSPGRMPADTKLYLYLDPGGLVARAPSTFEPDQFAGWVPHQQITYLWPSGPWYALFEAASVPDWIAHRLWIGSIMFAAGCGVLWACRRLALPITAALAAALLYQLSPFLLPYVSRTSLLLLPWAGLGWIVGLTIRATARAAEPNGPDRDGPVPAGDGWRRRLLPWREPASIALVVATVGSANATALALIAPAPVLWLVHAAWARIVTWRDAVLIALRTASLCLLVSLWWIAMLVVQSRHGAPVLAYSETLTDVSRNSTGSEVLRGLGYWLFYIRDPFGPATSAAAEYLLRTPLMVVGYAVTLLGLAGIALTSSPHRRFAALLVAVGAILSVGVHPIASSSPLMSLFAGDDGSGIALALRSSTRALPLLILGLAIGAGTLVDAIPRAHSARSTLPADRRVVAAGLIGLLVLANLPALWRFELVDPAIDRDEHPPAAWVEAADALDGGTGRVLQLPGAEFGAFRWGYTVDQPLVGLTGRPLVTRDLLPLGSAGAMDLLYALDDRFQEGTVEVASIAPVARLLGAGTVWVANDLEYERFRTPRPEVVDDLLTGGTDGLGPPRSFGAPVAVTPRVPMLDATALVDDRVGTPLAPVVLVPVERPVGVERAKRDTVVVAGSGDGLVDAAAAGVISGHETILYSAAVDDDERAALLGAPTPLVVTDSNRDRAHHWRGSQDVHGHTEPGGPAADVLDATPADQRLDLFGPDDPDLQTVAVQDGPVRAIASAYGEPFAYLPEHRAVMAVDGDPATAWLVGGHGDPVGERIRLTVAEPGATTVTLVQPAPPPGGRRIADVRLTRDGASTLDVELTDASVSDAGQTIELGAAVIGDVEIEITRVTAGDQARAASRAAVGFREIDLGLGATQELIRPPHAALDEATGPLTIVLTRLRVDPRNRWRSDPEPELARLVELPSDRSFDGTATIRLDGRAGDETIAALAGGAPTAVASASLAGAPRHTGMAAVDGDPSTSWITPIDGAVGAELRIATSGAPVGPAITISQPAGEYARVTALRIEGGGTTADVVVPPPGPDGRSTVELAGPVAADVVRFEITATDGATTVDRRFGDVVGLPAAIAEVGGPGLPVVPAPPDSTPVVAACDGGLLEVDGAEVPASFETTLGELLDGDPVEARLCSPLELGPGPNRILSTGRDRRGLTVDRLLLTDGAPAPAPQSAVTVAVERNDPRHRTLTVGGCDTGCWLVHGEGFNEAWSARLDGRSLGPPTQVDGGFNGWRLPPSAGPVTVDIAWTAQAPVTVGLAASGLGLALCLAVLALTRNRRPALAVAGPSDGDPPPSGRRPRVVAALALVIASTLLIGPVWGAISLAPAAATLLIDPRRTGRAGARVLESIGLVAAALVAVGAVVVLRRNRPLPDAGWTESFEQLNGLALFSVICLAVGASLSTARRRGASR